MLKLWLDDIRPMPLRFDVHVKTAQDAIDILKTGNVEEVSLDHDLGDDSGVGSGYDVAAWIEEAAYYGAIPSLKWNVHSANSVGIKNMETALTNADKFWNRK